MILRKAEIGGFQTVRKQYVQERDHCINLCKIGRSSRPGKDQRQAEIHQVAKKPARDSGNSIPKGLSGQFFNTAQGSMNFAQK